MKPNEKYFYCYSNRLNKFLYIFGVKFVEKGINPSNNNEFCVYERTETLRFLLQEWENIKSKIAYNGEMIKE